MTCYTFIRHGDQESAGADKPSTDPLRKLTTLGMRQATERREKLGNPNFDLVITSPAVRCIDTAKFLTGFQNVEIVTLSRLYIPEDKPLWKAFERIGYASLRDYMTQENDPNGVLVTTGKRAWNLIYPIASKASNVLIVSHAVLLNAIGVQHRMMVMNNVDVLYDVQFAPCEGFTMDNGACSLIQG